MGKKKEKMLTMCGGEDVKGPDEVIVTKHVKLSINILIFKFEVGRTVTRKKGN